MGQKDWGNHEYLQCKGQNWSGACTSQMVWIDQEFLQGKTSEFIMTIWGEKRGYMIKCFYWANGMNWSWIFIGQIVWIVQEFPWQKIWIDHEFLQGKKVWICHNFVLAILFERDTIVRCRVTIGTGSIKNARNYRFIGKFILSI